MKRFTDVAFTVVVTLSLLVAPASATVVQYSALLSGAQEVPPVGTNGMGMASVSLDTNSLLMSWNIEWWGLTGPATAAHFHGPAAAGVNAGVLHNIGPTNPAVGSTTISSTEYGYLVDELIYINVHTSAHGGGEIRGQLRVAGSHQLSPIMPDQDHSNRQRGVWVFNGADGGGAWFDPFAATGFHFATFDGISNFTDLIMPLGITPGPYTVNSIHGSVVVPAGAGYSFPAPVSTFTITDIIPGVDSDNPVAFPVFLAFDQPTVSFTMTAIPEPASLALLGTGIIVLLKRNRRRSA